MSETKGTVSELRDAAAAWKRKFESVSEKGEELAGQFVAFTGVNAGTFLGGVVDQWKGKELADCPGLKQFKVGSLPAMGALGAGLEVFSVLAMKKHANVTFALGHGFAGSYTNTLGRMTGQLLADRNKKNERSRSSETKKAAGAK